MKRIVRAILALSACSCSETRETAVAAEVLILSTSSRPTFASGLIASYAAVLVHQKGREQYTVFIPYFSPQQFLPSQGDKCRLSYQIAPVRGQVSPLLLHLDAAVVARRLECGSGRWQAPDQS